VLAQITTDAKSNEITALRMLLEMLSLKGTIVTTDTLDRQREIPRQVVDQGGDYVLALKGNQGTLDDDVRTFLDDPAREASATDRTLDADHVRFETGSASSAWLHADRHWPDLATSRKIRRFCGTRRSTSCNRMPPRVLCVANSSGRVGRRLARLMALV
jgi:predicted transposase YbfD/YdcC